MALGTGSHHGPRAPDAAYGAGSDFVAKALSGVGRCDGVRFDPGVPDDATFGGDGAVG
jgi:hypothetical protein